MNPLAWLVLWLTIQHQAQQEEIAAELVRRLVPLWRILDAQDLPGTQVLWLSAALPVIADSYRASQAAAAEFYTDVRHASIPEARELPEITPPPLDAAHVAVELVSTGPREVERKMQGGISPSVSVAPARAAEVQPLRPRVTLSSAEPSPVTPTVVSRVTVSPAEPGAAPRAPRVEVATSEPDSSPVRPRVVVRPAETPEEEASRVGFTNSTGRAVRLVADGGREVVRERISADREALGWARVVDSKPCYFCAVLASRGGVYKNEHAFDVSNAKKVGEGEFKVHDHCVCTLRPFYKADGKFDVTSLELHAQWNELTKGLSWPESMRAFRRGYIPPEPPALPVPDVPSLVALRTRLINSGLAPASEQVRWVDRQIKRFVPAKAA